MTKATIIFETSEEVDGYESKTTIERHNVDMHTYTARLQWQGAGLTLRQWP
jgi:hypothetical protein